MSNEITPTPAPQLIRILQAFSVDSLGDGDLIAGANVLVSMCASLANLYPPASGLITPNGNRLQVGLSFVSVGGLTSSLVNERVLDPIAAIQNNLGDHLAADNAHSAATTASMPMHERARVRSKPSENPSPMEQLGLTIACEGMSPPRDSSPLRTILRPSLYHGLDSIGRAPAVFLSADSGGGLQKQLAQSHRRFPYVRAMLTDGPGMTRLESQLLAVVHGTSLSDEVAGPVHIRGQVAASCPLHLLAQATAAGEGTLLSNFVWLPDWQSSLNPAGAGCGGGPSLFPIHARYIEALQQAWAYRLDYRNEALTFRFDWQQVQRQWVAFLQRMEPSCPGVTRAARSLLATLLFGSHLLTGAGEQGGWSVTGVLDLAQFIVKRMALLREHLLFSEQQARLQALAIKMVEKLEAGPLTPRALTRKKSKLRIGDCRKVLDLFHRLGIACPVGDDEWKLVLTVESAVEKLKAPYVDV